MDHDSPLDIVYRLSPGIVSSIKSVDSVTVLGPGASLELSLSLFQVLMAFAEKKTTRQAFHMLDVDVELHDFGTIIQEFFERGLLRRDVPLEHGPSLRQVLAGGVFGDRTRADKLGAAMRQGRAIVISDALPADFAERVHDELDRSNGWAVAEGGHDFFHYRFSGIAQIEAQGGVLAECSQLFGSSATRSFIAELSGQDCAGEAYAAAAWYRPGEYALPHDDSVAQVSRSVAYIWYLTKDWRQEWGGALFWCPTGQYIGPRFNMLVMFNVTPSNMHLVCPVSPAAIAKRLTINGFWHHAEPRPSAAPVPPDAWFSPAVCGLPAREYPDLLPIVVL